MVLPTASPALPSSLEEYSRQSETGIRAVLRDIYRASVQKDVWLAFALEKTRSRFARSFLGVLWVAVSFAAFVVGLVIIFRGHTEFTPDSYAVYVALGFTAYQFVVSNLSEGANVYVTSSGWIRSTNLPYFTYILISVFKNSIPFGIQIICSLVLMLFSHWQPTWTTLLVIPNTALILLNLLWIQYFLGLLGAKFRDMTHLITSFTRILFFLTPVIWYYEQREGLAKKIALLNPVTHYVELFRMPMMNEIPSPTNYLVVLGLTSVGWLFTMITHAKWRHHLPLWVA